MEWPPPYHLRLSKRANNIRLEITEEKGLEIILPHKASQKSALDFLEKNRKWIEKHQKFLKRVPEDQKITPSFQLPDRIMLPAIQKEWKIVHDNSSKKIASIKIFPERILISGENITQKKFKILMIKFLKASAKRYLTPALTTLSRQHQLPFKKVIFRIQKSRWGSCSSQHHLSLNVLLLFMPPQVLEYIMIHELCHTLYLNHSKKFWKKVASLMTDYKIQQKKLRDYRDYLPKWWNS